jgi:photosystem II stability/assembly factor-like uncharacterized protein
MKNILFFCILIALFSCSDSKTTNGSVKQETTILKPINCNSSAHFRGIQAVTDKLVWLSGTSGTVLRTEDGGKKWLDISVPDCQKLDFRDIHALNKNTAWVMSSGNGVRIYHTSDGGVNWNLQFQDTSSVVFMDGMDFYNSKEGIVYGDPVKGVMDALVTKDGGKNWSRSLENKLPPTLKGEAGFAASGTGVVHRGQNIWMATGGGEVSRIMKSEDSGENWNVIETPIKGGAGVGIFSMAFRDDLKGVVVGGSYIDSTNVADNCAYTEDGGLTWTKVENNGPKGFRSCVVVDNQGVAVACGRTGIDKSLDFKNWTPISNAGYFTADLGKKYIWLAGRRGSVAVLMKY